MSAGLPECPADRVRVNCHLHTVASGDAVLTLDELAAWARDRGPTQCA
jgi:histidinol phosphatase-like PHP family hydrolase